MSDLRRKILLVSTCLVSPFVGLVFGKLLHTVGVSLIGNVEREPSDGSAVILLMTYMCLLAMVGASMVTYKNWYREND